MRTTHSSQPTHLSWLTIPLLSGLVLLTSLYLYRGTLYTYEKVTYLSLAGLAGFFILWTALAGVLVVLARARKKSISPILLPWFMKPLLVGAIGTTSIASPALATNSVVQEYEAPAPSFFLQAEEETTVSPFFAPVAAPSTPKQTPLQTPPETLEAQEVSITVANAQRYQGAFFTNPEHNQEQETEPTHVVLQGETLWSIAEAELPQSATGVDVLHKVYQLQQANQDQIPSLDTLIYPGQILKLPTPSA